MDLKSEIKIIIANDGTYKMHVERRTRAGNKINVA